MTKGYTKESIIPLLQKYYEENDRFLSLDIYNKKKYKPSETTIRKKFGSWNQALTEAGIPINRHVDKWYTKEDVIHALRASSENGFALTVSEYKERKMKPYFETVISYFGTWNKAVKAAGLKENRVHANREEMIESIQLFAEMYPDDVNTDKYEEANWRPSLHAIYRMFGSWLNALEEAEVTSSYSTYSDEELKSELIRCAKAAYPEPFTIKKYTELSNSNSPHPYTIARRFGKWKDVKRFVSSLSQSNG